MNAIDHGQLQAFAHRGWAFLCGAQPDGQGNFLPVVFCMGSAPGRQTELPRDTEAYATEAEAMRHAEQQAERWVREHEDTRGQE
ncbi:hypothetical protein QTH97_15280 [Variovorax sp. J22R24]|uniref:hypothetical protein n=1 Tax=Variovorax gracilis TaxID=3053502 RepID=UPI0025791D93|nr:hypothetical protein [Variovorax sp. J22R24]MDM0106308.1 hypothetical protein [Variovorax sp. J22R24]